mmetsp:Transcript_138019/g.358509  ORF Transcript_138019/g.358509 Transcript_138019/m.358509 type:complete len:116 (+) Transcript_138019:596-943(+)
MGVHERTTMIMSTFTVFSASVLVSKQTKKTKQAAENGLTFSHCSPSIPKPGLAMASTWATSVAVKNWQRRRKDACGIRCMANLLVSKSDPEQKAYSKTPNKIVALVAWGCGATMC